MTAEIATRQRHTVRPSTQRGLRTDIQGLRAIAVLSVVVYHLWPHRVTGGFVGVDVFFVISGFLITTHLLASRPRRPRDLLQFWSRRIRRLLPASLLVLAVTLLASRLVAPETQWANTANQVRAAALYVVNWRLADDSVDYLAAENAASPVQHFWSLSVEEQFYLGWPVVVLLLGLVGVALRRRAAAMTVGVAALVAGSLAYSIYLTGSDPARAYFVTPTRIWELAAGGLLAAVLAARSSRDDDARAAGVIGPRPRAVLAWLGIGLIAYTVFRYDAATPFPGWQAAVPVVGAVAVIAAHARADGLSPGRILALRPVQWLGDVSYSVYLWHWPLIVLVPAVSGGHLGLLDKAVVLVVSGALAALTKRYVEDRFRAARWGRPLGKPYALAAVGMAVVVAAAMLQTHEVRSRNAAADRQLQSALTERGPCFGAAALHHEGCPSRTSGRLTPTPLAAAGDKSHAYSAVSGKPDCFAFLPSFPETRCTFGEPSSKVRVALVGNSHAGQWVDAMNDIGTSQHWRVDTFLASQCALSSVAQTFPTAAQSQACSSWVDRTTRAVAAGRYDVVVLTNRISVTAAGSDLEASQARYAAGYHDVVTRLLASGTRVVGIRDTPAPHDSMPDCLAAHPDDYGACDGTRATWLPSEPLVGVVRQLADPRVTLIDVTDELCQGDVCPAAIGGVPVYFDGSHLTSTYSRTLAPFLLPALQAAVAA